MKHNIQLPYWKKGMKVKCPECGKKVKAPYVCECGAELKLKVRIGKYMKLTKFKCPKCKKAELVQSKFTQTTYGCPICRFVFSESYLQGYLNGLRDNKNPHCDSCGKSLGRVCDKCQKLWES